MAEQGGYLFLVRMDVDPAHEDDFNSIYDEEHIPDILTVPGVRHAARYKLDRTSRGTPMEGQARYLAIYEVDSAEVPDSAAFNEASDRGQWKGKVRPFTTNRSHVIYKRL